MPPAAFGSDGADALDRRLSGDREVDVLRGADSGQKAIKLKRFDKGKALVLLDFG